MSETRRQQLIRQLRSALGDLQKPNFFDSEETLIFTIGDLDDGVYESSKEFYQEYPFFRNR